MSGHQATCSQVSAVLFYTWTVKFVRAQICVGDMSVSRLQVKGWQHHLSQNIGPAIAESAGPVLPALKSKMAQNCSSYPHNSTHCATLPEYAREAELYFTFNTTIVFLPGDHVLDTNITVANVAKKYCKNTVMRDK